MKGTPYRQWDITLFKEVDVNEFDVIKTHLHYPIAHFYQFLFAEGNEVYKQEIKKWSLQQMEIYIFCKVTLHVLSFQVLTTYAENRAVRECNESQWIWVRTMGLQSSSACLFVSFNAVSSQHSPWSKAMFR